MSSALVPGDYCYVINNGTERPLFFDWRFERASEEKCEWIPPGSIATVLSRSIMNPFSRDRLRKVLTPRGVGFMWEDELSLEPFVVAPRNPSDDNVF